MRMALALALPLLLGAASLRAQSSPKIEISVVANSTSPSVAVRGVLDERPFDELLRSGFPVHLRFRAELWMTGRWFDNVVDHDEWDVVLHFDVIDQTYEVARKSGALVVVLGNYKTFADARAASELPFTPSLTPRVRGRKGYVAVQIDVETLEMSDLAELQRWLRGEAAPAVQGRRNPGTALTKGFRTLVTRLLGGEVRHLEARSGVIDF